MKRWMTWLLIMPLVVQGGPAEERVARLLQEQWASPDVRIEWEFYGEAPPQLVVDRQWRIADESQSLRAGGMVVCFESNDQTEPRTRLCVSGRARVYRTCLTPRQVIAAGQMVDIGALEVQTAECSRLKSRLLSESDLDAGVVAARTLVPRRPLSQGDVRLAPIIRRGQQVEVHCRRGAVLVKTAGRALKDGVRGERIPVMLLAGEQRRVKGRVIQAGQVELEI